MWLGSGTSLYRVDMATGATTLVGDTGVELGSLAALNGKLYITGTGEFMSGGEVFKIDSDTAQAHSVYTYPPQWPPLLGELASDGHLLWIAEWWVGEPGPPGDYKLRAFDPSTGDWPFEIYWCTVTEPIFLDALEVVAFRQSPAIPAISGPGLLILVGSLALGGVALLRARAALG